MAKGRNIHTNCEKQQKTKKKQRASVGYMPLCCYMR